MSFEIKIKGQITQQYYVVLRVMCEYTCVLYLNKIEYEY